MSHRMKPIRFPLLFSPPRLRLSSPAPHARAQSRHHSLHTHVVKMVADVAGLLPLAAFPTAAAHGDSSFFPPRPPPALTDEGKKNEFCSGLFFVFDFPFPLLHAVSLSIEKKSTSRERERKKNSPTSHGEQRQPGPRSPQRSPLLPAAAAPSTSASSADSASSTDSAAAADPGGRRERLDRVDGPVPAPRGPSRDHQQPSRARGHGRPGPGRRRCPGSGSGAPATGGTARTG